MLKKSKSRFLSDKKLIYLLSVGLFSFLNAQGITNTLGGNTAEDKFIVENSYSEAGLVVTGEGNVGIGISVPESKLHIYNGAGGFTGTHMGSIDAIIEDDHNAYLEFNAGTGAWSGITFADDDKSFRAGILFNHTSDYLSFRTGDSDGRMVIQEDGDVGIGTFNPGAKLEVNGKIKIGTDDGTPTAGTIRFLDGHFEGYDGTTWKQLDN
ncbi:hypothetical protein KKF86_00805 [bacterium]|nr:hypothetical protein [bacterium]